MATGEASGLATRGTALLTTHFGGTGWVELLLQRARGAFPWLADDRVFVIDQNRTADSADELRRRLGPVQVLTYPASEPHVVMTGHDHAHVLNLAVREIACDHLLIFDSDAHPVSPAAAVALGDLAAGHDAVLAAFDAAGTATHPCFMLLGPAVDRDALRFDEGQLETGVDTGRRVFDQLDRLGLRAALLRPAPAFNGCWGTLYLDGSIYHHGSGSFESAADPRLQRQARYWRRERDFYERRVRAGRYELSTVERWTARGLAARRERPGRVGSALLGRAHRLVPATLRRPLRRALALITRRA